MRTLTFKDDEASRKIFTTLYVGFLMGSPREGVRGIANTRTAMKIMEKFEALAKKESDYKAGDQRYMLPSGEVMLDLAKGGKMALEGAEYNMLMAHLNECPWRPAAAREAVAAVEFLEKAPES